MKLTEEKIREEYSSESIKPERVRQLVKMENFPPDLLAQIATSDPYAFLFDGTNWQARRIARKHPNLPIEVLNKYLEWGSLHTEALYSIADVLVNPSITTEMFNEMIKIPNIDWKEHRKLQGGGWLEDKEDDGSPPDKKERLDRIIEAIAHHPNCPLPILVMALEHKEPLTRARGARSPKLSATQIKKILVDPNSYVRINIVRNKNVPIELLMTLLEPLPAGVKPLGGQYRVIQYLVKRLPKGSIERARALDFLVSFNQGQGTRVLIAKESKDANQISQKAIDKSRTVRKAAVRNPLASNADKVAATLMGDSNINVIMVKKV